MSPAYARRDRSLIIGGMTNPTIDDRDQYRALTASAALADVSDRTRIAVTGDDRATFLHSFCTNDIKQLAPGRGCEAFVTNHQGKTVGHVHVFCRDDHLLLETSPGQAQTLIAHFERFVISERVEFRDVTGETAQLLLAGPLAAGILNQLSGSPPPPSPLSHAAVSLAGIDATVCRVELAGPDTFFLQLRRNTADTAESALLAAGAVPCSAVALEMARLEAGFPLFGADITEDNLPQEVSRDERAISFRKGCYLGQETVARIDALGHVNRVLTAVKFAGDAVPHPGTELFAGEKLVGSVTSATFSPRLGAPLALAYVRRLQAQPGTQLTTAIAPATIVQLPLA